MPAVKPESDWDFAFRALADAPIASYELDLEGRIVRINAAGCQLIGLPEQQIVGHYVWEFVAPQEQDTSKDRFRRTVSGEQGLTTVERNWVRPDGERVVLEIHSSPIRDAQGTVRGIRSFPLNITARKRAEEALRKIQEGLENRIKERTAQLELTNEFLRQEIAERHRAEEERRKLENEMQHAQRLKSLGVLAGGIAHDFNNLLASIMGYASLAAMDVAEGSRARKSLDQVLTAAKSAADLTQQMLAYSGRGSFVLEPVNVTRLIEGVIRLLETSISKKAALQLYLAPNLPAIQADASQIRQVVMNLITNAAEALGEDAGRVKVTTGVRPADFGELSAITPGKPLPGGNYVYVEVSDTGCGMDSETLSKIFDPFFTTKFTGRGLGLAAVLGIIRSHHGSIQVSSQPGKGTTFQVFFPAIEVPPPREAARAEPRAWRGEGVVLVVDDQPAVQNLARMILERVGLSVLSADDGQQALEVFRRHAPEIHAVLLDLNMPGMDGGEVLEHIRQWVPDIRVVLCSGYNENDVSAKIKGPKPAAFLRKPYRPSELIDRLRAIW